MLLGIHGQREGLGVRVPGSSSAGGEQQSVATPQTARGWARSRFATFSSLYDFAPRRERPGGSAQYGELSHTDRLLWLLAPTRDHVFCDLGSGRGKLVLHAALKTAVGYSLGDPSTSGHPLVTWRRSQVRCERAG